MPEASITLHPCEIAVVKSIIGRAVRIELMSARPDLCGEIVSRLLSKVDPRFGPPTPAASVQIDDRTRICIMRYLRGWSVNSDILNNHRAWKGIIWLR